MGAIGSGTQWAIYDRPELRDSISHTVGDDAREVLLTLDGIHCAACVARVERELAPLAEQIRVNLAARTVQFRFAPSRIALSAILERLDRGGFQPQLLAQDADLNAQRRAGRNQLAQIGVAVLCAMQVMMLAWPAYRSDAASIDPSIMQLLRWTQWLFATPALFYGGQGFFRNAWRALSSGRVDMDVPIAASLAIAYGVSAWRTLAGGGELYFDSATMFVMLLSGARFLESRSRLAAGGHLRRLASARRLLATRLDGDGVERRIPLAAVVAGDLLRVAPGEAVPVDGVLLDGDGELDEALLSGEARPVLRRAGAALLAGSVNVGSQTLSLRAEGVGSQTWLAQITRLLQRAQAERPAYQQLLDRHAGSFVAVILLLAASALLAWWSIDSERAIAAAIAVLVASCPCALSLAAPLSLAAGSGRLAASGVLVARPAALERLAAVDTVIFDKTGTLTEPRFSLSRCTPLAEMPPERVLAIAAALERGLSHPLAAAFRAHDQGLEAREVHSVPGQGVSGDIDGIRYHLGGADARADGAVPADADPAATVLGLRDGTRVLAWLELRSALRAGAAELVAALRTEGIAVELLSGDGDAAVRAAAATLGIDTATARLRPDEKLFRLRRLQSQGHVVLAVGDGVNDAPLLAGADVSCAMPGGAALAQSRADLLLIGDSLASLRDVRAMARAIQRRVRQNIAWALGYNLLVLPLAAAGLLSPWMAALGMSLSSLLVVANAQRLPRIGRG